MINLHPESWFTFHQERKLRLVRVKRHTFFGKCKFKMMATIEFLSPDDKDRSPERLLKCTRGATTEVLRVSTFYGTLVESFAYCDGHGGLLRAEMELAKWLEEKRATLITARRALYLTRQRRRSSARQFMGIKFDD